MGLLTWLFGPPDIDKLKSKADIDGLAEALRHEEPNIRKAAAAALGEIGAAAQRQKQAARLERLQSGASVISPVAHVEDRFQNIVGSVSAALKGVVDDANAAVRREAVAALAPLRGFYHHRDGLIVALSDDQPSVRRLAAETLVLWDSEFGPAVEPLIAKLQDDDVDVRVAARVTLETWFEDERRDTDLAKRARAALQAQELAVSNPVAGSIAVFDAGDEHYSISDDQLKYLVAKLLVFYLVRPAGFIRGAGWSEEDKIRAIGARLNRKGGIELMRQVHDAFRTRCTIPGAPRNLEILWDGIGIWKG